MVAIALGVLLGLIMGTGAAAERPFADRFAKPRFWA
jgi:hypothetical protein